MTNKYCIYKLGIILALCVFWILVIKVVRHKEPVFTKYNTNEEAFKIALSKYKNI